MSHIRNIASRLAKVILSDELLKKVRQKKINKLSPPPFNGIYNNFNDASLIINTSNAHLSFSDNSYIHGLESHTEKMSSIINDTIPNIVDTWSYLPLIVATGQDDIKILDFGGSIGQEYAHIRSCLKDGANRVRYHVVDMPAITAIGEKYWDWCGNITFSEDIPHQGTFDIVHCSGSIHYVDNYKEFLNKISNYGAKFITITRTPVYTGDTCVRIQINMKNHMPQWLFNLGEFEKIMHENGYRLAMRAKSGENYNVSNYPIDKQVGWLTNMIFVRR